LKPGERLTEIDLASKLRVSRTPLRHALQRLVSEGWLCRSTNGAVHVVSVSKDEIEALYAVRSALEELMIVQAARRLDPAAFNELREILVLQDQAAKVNNAELVSAQGERFHHTLWTYSGNQVGAEYLGDVLQRTTRYRRLSFSVPYRFREGSKQHWQILRALEAGNVAKACRLLRTHVNQSRNYVIQAFQEWEQNQQRKEIRGHQHSADTQRSVKLVRKRMQP
jgi:DNA-binding GntR family transcriptional regulator